MYSLKCLPRLREYCAFFPKNQKILGENRQKPSKPLIQTNLKPTHYKLLCYSLFTLYTLIICIIILYAK